jgi:branched-subunit amino acid transport protein
MTGTWATVILVGLATFAIKAAGPLLLGGRELPPRLQGMLDHLPPALLAALIVTQALGDEVRLTLDLPRLLGLAAAAVALAVRAPVLLVLVAATATTALARLLL